MNPRAVSPEPSKAIAAEVLREMNIVSALYCLAKLYLYGVATNPLLIRQLAQLLNEARMVINPADWPRNWSAKALRVAIDIICNKKTADTYYVNYRNHQYILQQYYRFAECNLRRAWTAFEKRQNINWIWKFQTVTGKLEGDLAYQYADHKTNPFPLFDGEYNGLALLEQKDERYYSYWSREYDQFILECAPLLKKVIPYLNSKQIVMMCGALQRYLSIEAYQASKQFPIEWKHDWSMLGVDTDPYSYDYGKEINVERFVAVKFEVRTLEFQRIEHRAFLDVLQAPPDELISLIESTAGTDH